MTDVAQKTIAPADITLRNVGKPVPRKEDARLVTGQGRFSDDFSFPGQAYAVMVRSPHPHARILGIDAARAKAMPGVLGVFTGADCLADGLGPIPHDPVPKTKFDMKLTGPGGGAVFIGPHMLLPADKARHVGEAVAMVVAETRGAGARCRRGGRGRLRGAARSSIHSEDAMRRARRPSGTRCRDNVPVDTRSAIAPRPTPPSRPPIMWWRWTSISTASPACRWSRARRSAQYDAATGRYTLYAGSGGAVRQKRELATMLGIRPRSCACSPTTSAAISAPATASLSKFGLVLWAARKVGRPVKFTATRSEAFLSDYQGRDLVTKVELALAQGRPLPRDARDQYQQCGRALRLALAAAQGRRPDPRLLRHPGGDACARSAVFTNTMPTRPTAAPAGPR